MTGFVEYALLLALVALAAITAAMGLLGTAINNRYNSATASLNGAS